jgi:hypothetical protein
MEWFVGIGISNKWEGPKADFVANVQNENTDGW